MMGPCGTKIDSFLNKAAARLNNIQKTSSNTQKLVAFHSIFFCAMGESLAVPYNQGFITVF